MQRQDKRPTFYFQADANSLGGFLEQPFQRLVPQQASVSLPAAGGFATARAEGFNLDQIVSCTSSHTRVSGRETTDGRAFSTLVTAVIEGLNILEIVTAERVVAQISVECPADYGSRRISLAGSHFQGLRVGGHDASPTLNPSFLNAQRAGSVGSPMTWADFRSIGEKQSRTLIDAIKRQAQSAAWEWAQERYEWMGASQKRQDGALVQCSLVDAVASPIPGNSLGHIIEIPDFGRIILGELLVSSDSVQLSMIRAELGCHVHGKLITVQAGSGGTMMPPILSSH
jgi:hypothetical protein